MNKSIQHAIRLGLCGVVLATSACKESAVEPTAAAEPADVAMPVSEGRSKSGSIVAGLGQQVASAVADLSTKTGIDKGDITVVEARTVTWGSGATGCPEEGMNYTQSVVPGVLMLLEADGQVYRYHGREGSPAFHCPDDRATAPAYGPGEEFM